MVVVCGRLWFWFFGPNKFIFLFRWRATGHNISHIKVCVVRDDTIDRVFSMENIMESD